MNETPHDRDTWLEQPLRDAMRAQRADEPTAACLDAETLAAWADDTLPARHRSTLEAHAATCARCQSLLAAMVRTAPPPAAAPRRSLRLMAWFVPLAATATAVLVWTSTEQRDPARSASSTVATHAVEVSPVAPPSPTVTSRLDGVPTDAREQAKPSSSPATLRDEAAIDFLAANDKRKEEESKTAAVGRQRGAGNLGTETDRKKDTGFTEAATARFAPTPPPAPGAASPTSTMAESVTVQAPPPAAPAQAASAPAGAAAENRAADATAKRQASTMAAEPPVARRAIERQSDAAAAAPKLAASDVAARGALLRLADAPQPLKVVESIDGKTKWLIATGGTVMRSSDGKTWDRQQTGTAVTLTAISAPSERVCWMVGPSGVVVRTIDGKTWTRVAFPEAVDLASILAANDRVANITTSDGRTFATNNGGASWTQTRR